MKKQNLKFGQQSSKLNLFTTSAIPASQLIEIKGGGDSSDDIIIIEDPVN